MSLKNNRTVDLHGLSVPKALEKFIQFYNQCIKECYKDRIEVVHGYGSSGIGGDIKKELLLYLNKNSRLLVSFLEGDKIGNPGVTIVYPKDRLPIYNTNKTERIIRIK